MRVVLCCVVLCCACMHCMHVHEQAVSHGNSPPPPPNLPPPPPDIIPYGKRSPRRNTIWQTYPRKKSHGRTSPGEKQHHNYGKASPSMVDLPPPPHTFLDKGTNTMADCPPENYTIWQTFPMKEYLMENLPPGRNPIAELPQGG